MRGWRYSWKGDLNNGILAGGAGGSQAFLSYATDCGGGYLVAAVTAS